MGTYRKIVAEEGYKGLYKDINILWGKKVPFTILNFCIFESFVQYFYDNKFL